MGQGWKEVMISNADSLYFHSVYGLILNCWWVGKTIVSINVVSLPLQIFADDGTHLKFQEGKIQGVIQ